MDNKIFQLSLRSLIYVIFYLPAALFTTVVLADVNDLQVIDSDKVLFSKAVQFSTQQQWAQAEPIYRDLLLRNKFWPEPGNNLAVLLLKTQRIDEARNVLEQAVSSSPSYKITQQNRTRLYNYLATRAYDKALGAAQALALPELQLIEAIYQPVKIKIVEKEVEKIIIQKEFIERSEPITVQVDEKIAKQKNISNHINKQLLGWSRAWSQGDFKHYIQSYSEDFRPSDARKSYAEWKNLRRARLRFTKGVSVGIDQLRVFIEPQKVGETSYALVEFIQNYRSDTYSDRVLKQMYMQHQQGSWLILSERTIKNF